MNMHIGFLTYQKHLYCHGRYTHKTLLLDLPGQKSDSYMGGGGSMETVPIFEL
jgi:hypothetical protein